MVTFDWYSMYLVLLVHWLYEYWYQSVSTSLLGKSKSSTDAPSVHSQSVGVCTEETANYLVYVS